MGIMISWASTKAGMMQFSSYFFINGTLLHLCFCLTSHFLAASSRLQTLILYYFTSRSPLPSHLDPYILSVSKQGCCILAKIDFSWAGSMFSCFGLSHVVSDAKKIITFIFTSFRRKINGAS